jgi:hypothetical protein
LSPLLFSIYLNDLEKYFIELNGNPLELLSEQSVNELNVFIKLFVILYADDTVILTDTKEGVQNALNIFHSVVLSTSQLSTLYRMPCGNLQRYKIIFSQRTDIMKLTHLKRKCYQL